MPAGVLHICGTGEYLKLGLGDQQDRESPVPVTELADMDVTHVACGKFHTACITAAGDVYAWGLEGSGQLGLGSTRTKAPTPKKVEELSGIGVKQLSCGLYHTLALTESGDVFSCGFAGSFLNGAGGLGHGDRKQLDTPKRIAAFGAESGVFPKVVYAGGFHSSALDTEGRVWTWGRGEWGRLGFGDSSDVLEPQHLEAADELSPIDAPVGEAHSALLTKDGRVFTWGRNEHWQLGYEVAGLLNSGQSFDAQADPQQVPLPSTPARLLSCGELGTVAMLEDQSIYMWGMRRNFEPTAVLNTDIVQGEICQLAAGASHFAVRTKCGRVYTYGTGTPLGFPKVERKSWELAEVTAFEGKRIIFVACGSSSTAMIVER